MMLVTPMLSGALEKLTAKNRSLDMLGEPSILPLIIPICPSLPGAGSSQLPHSPCPMGYHSESGGSYYLITTSALSGQTLQKAWPTISENLPGAQTVLHKSHCCYLQ